MTRRSLMSSPTHLPTRPDGHAGLDPGPVEHSSSGRGPVERVAVDRILCAGRGVCSAYAAELAVDEWGYPLASSVLLSPERATQLLTVCPARALYRAP